MWDAGGNFIDTADLYTNGTSETWLGQSIADRQLRERIVAATRLATTPNRQPKRRRT